MSTERALPIDDDVFDDAVGLRRDLHRRPELRFTEERSGALLAERMEKLGWEVHRGIGGTGLVATLAGERRHPHVLVRADMDALPVPDLKDVPYRSAVPGVAHACGHDVHMAVVVAVGALLSREDALPGTVSLVFQPAEEIPYGESSGAQAMLDGGVLDLAPGDAILGLHCWPDLPAGTIGVDEHIAMAAKDAFGITLHGTPAHAATPHRGRDALLAASQCITGLHALVSRQVCADEQAALNVGTIEGGHSQSVVPDAVRLTGTIRTIEPAVRTRLKAEVERLVGGTAAAWGVDADLVWRNEMPALRNDPGLVRRALDTLPRHLGGGDVVRLAKPPMTADDFALFAERMPGLYVKLGVCGGAGCPPLHSSDFDVDERAIAYGAAALRALAVDLLHQPVPSVAPPPHGTEGARSS